MGVAHCVRGDLLTRFVGDLFALLTVEEEDLLAVLVEIWEGNLLARLAGKEIQIRLKDKFPRR